MNESRHPPAGSDSSDGQSPPASDRELDLRGLNCPLPILKTKKALSEMDDGEVLHATTTDPMSVIDFTVFCEKSGHMLEHTVEHKTGSEQEFEFFIRRGV